MDKKKLSAVLKKVRENSKERKFVQSVDLIINLKEYDAKKDPKVEEFIKLPKGRGKEAKVCALVGPEMKVGAEKLFDKVIISNDFSKWNGARKARKLARSFDFFIAQADMMPKIAQVFGKFFGPLNKMPNPKSGAIVPPNTAAIAAAASKFKDMIKAATNKNPVIQCSIGTENMKDEDLVDNLAFVIDHMQSHLPRGKQNIKNMILKTTMGRKVVIE